MSQKDLAQALGVTQIAISKIETGVTKKSRYLGDICAFLELPSPATAKPQKPFERKPAQSGRDSRDMEWLSQVFGEFVREAAGREAFSRWSELAAQALPEIDRPSLSQQDRDKIVEEARLQGRIARLRLRP